MKLSPKRMEMTTDNFETALEAAEKGYIPVAILPGLKVPAEAGWDGWMTRPVTEESIAERWKGTRNGLAILCKDLVVFDVDEESKLDLVLQKCGLKGAPVCRTPGGGYHVHARMRRGVERSRKIRVHGEPVDLLTGVSLSILPPSVNEAGVPYEWLTPGLPPISELPVANVGWTRERTRWTVRQLVIDDADAACRRARAYLAHIEGAISGQRGHDRTMRVAGVLVQKFGLSVEQALPLFFEWNNQCEPPWTERELLHKLHDAAKNLGKSNSLSPLKGGP